MKIGLFFGSFNPIHHGHLIIANLIIEHTELDQIWFVVSPQSPFKKKGSLLKEQDRLYLVQLAIEDNPNFRATDIEFRMPKPSYTIDTLVYLKEKYPQHTFSLIMGEDNINQIDNWKNGKIIKREHTIYVYKRDVENTQIYNDEKIKTLNFPYLDISATYIRTLIKDKKSAKYLLPEKVWKYIEDYKLYR
jgi:nicotinate-nucleotide adenylyltransferase